MKDVKSVGGKLRKCGECRYYVSCGVGGNEECHRNPPEVMFIGNKEYIGVWPVVSSVGAGCSFFEVLGGDIMGLEYDNEGDSGGDVCVDEGFGDKDGESDNGYIGRDSGRIEVIEEDDVDGGLDSGTGNG